LYESRAQGGPKDGIKIGAGLNWNGVIPRKITEGYRHFYQGYYAWHPIEQRWEWHEKEIKKQACRTPQGIAHFKEYQPIE
jgi:hypothetical protein